MKSDIAEALDAVAGDDDLQDSLMAEALVLKAQIKRLELHGGDGEKETLTASVSFDVWSFGIVMYEMCTDTRLFNRSNEDDLHTDTEKHELVNWKGLSEECCEKILQCDKCTMATVDDRNAATQLIAWCLQKDPSQRPTMTEVVAHPFFHAKEANLRHLLEDLAVKVDQTVHLTVSALSKVVEQAKVFFRDSLLK